MEFPLHRVVLKVGGALAAGCTVVLEPTEVAPLTTYALADIFDEIGLPAGVFSLVSGFGPVVGEAIAGHPEVVAKEEIFGPVLSIIGYRDEDDAVRIANATEYGLAAGIWSGDQDRADRVARPVARRPGRGERREVRHQRPVRRVQAVRHRPRGRRRRLRRPCAFLVVTATKKAHGRGAQLASR
ncbi:delta 1-pyrroline-5-carboxylate dehydrogenase [Rhodococcus percolatus]|nr:delta 1-pyrroline-5-carboxylate dehydrogenase [Rhodococcus opacus]MBP2208574.1 delta 1-pyrroline-5-carboxylate dehydrogenase [Rhodococcus opacus]